MDEDIQKMLAQWELSEYIPVFQANKITLNVLPMLDAALIKDLICPIGDRAKFLTNLENWKTLTKNKESPCPSPTISVEFVDMLNDSHRKIVSFSEFLNLPVNETHENNENNDFQNNDINENNDSQSNKNNEITSIEKMDTSMSGPSHSSPLRTLLTASHDGQGLLNLYETEGRLSNNGRRKLCNLIITNLLKDNPSKRIDGSVLLEKAAQIKEVFNKENISTYFIPYVNNTTLKIKRCAKGKLYDCLQNRRREYRDAKVITPARKKLNRSESAQSSGLSEQTESCNEEDIVWLKNNTEEPFHKVEEKWRSTAQFRLKTLKSSNSSIDTYMSTYPILKSPRGMELLIMDFEIMYPGTSNMLFDNFSVLKSKILSISLSKNSVPEIKELIEIYLSLNSGDENYEETSNIVALLLLPLLIGNPTHRTKKNRWRPSKAEVRDGFITHVTRTMDLEDIVTKRREKYSKFGLTFQPTIIILGPNYAEIQKYYVIINNYYYLADSILKAVDICFKCFHALYSHYPTESSCVWNFIQKGIYKIYTEWDKNYSTVNAFASDLGIEIR